MFALDLRHYSPSIRWRLAPMGILFAFGLVLAGCDSKSNTPVATGNTGPSSGMNTGPSSGNIEAGTQQDLVVNVGDRIYFETNETGLSPEAQSTLQRQAAWLKRHSNLGVTIEGHADERGTREFNLGLGARRASSARDYLVSLGISPQRINTVSYGKERPVELCSEEYCWAKNRRAVTIVDPNLSS